jgi:hypothetical protein
VKGVSGCSRKRVSLSTPVSDMSSAKTAFVLKRFPAASPAPLQTTPEVCLRVTAQSSGSGFGRRVGPCSEREDDLAAQASALS